MTYLKFTYLNRSIPVFPVNNEIIKLKERRFLKVEAPFINRHSGLGIIQLQGHNTFDS